MNPVIAHNAYGKGQVCFTKLKRLPDRHEVFQITCATELEGDFAQAYTRGDNSLVIATDSIRNTTYALAADHNMDSLEEFGLFVAKHYLAKYPQVSKATVSLSLEHWDRIQTDGRPHPAAFLHRGNERRTTRVSTDRTGNASIVSGLCGLSILRSHNCGWSNFVRDEFRTLDDTTDRIVATIVDATWQFNTHSTNYNACFEEARAALIYTFANHTPSLGVQHTLHAMACHVLRQRPDIESVSLMLPNRHHIPFDLSRLGGRVNKNEIFHTTSEPFGIIRETVVRQRSKM